MCVRSLLLLLLVCCIGNTGATDTVDSYNLYLVRHSEKQEDDSNDPALSDAGRVRSEQLATWLQNKDIEDVWSSDYQRSRDTAGPLISSLGVELNLYDPRDLPALAEALLDIRHNALIVGHSNTTPELARLLCQCAIDDMDESDYEQLIIVSVSGKKVRAEILTQSSLFSADS